MSSAHLLSSSGEAVDTVGLLFEISRTLDESLELKEVVQPVLRAISERLGFRRAMLALLNRDSREISVDASWGMTLTEQELGRYKLGEGVTGKVVASGEPVVLAHVANEPTFLNRTGVLDDRDLSFLCIPIKLDGVTIGAISADLPASSAGALDEMAQLISIVASMIAQAVRLRQAVMEQQAELSEENARLHEELRDRFRPSNIIGNARKMDGLFGLIAQVAPSNTTVLIRGESGTGKELVAHAIHYNSPRASKPFVKVNCAALPETVIESELFGHEKGAFTGAMARRKGRFELAHGGTIFLDEIGELSPATQVKLLRVLQEREFERVGGHETLQSDVRVITATNRPLEDMLLDNSFRQDLYYRLNVFPVRLPPLRERKTDITLLADHFIEKYNRANTKQVRRISTPAIDMLMSYHWPGNVRELENCIERACLLSSDGVIHGHHLPPSLQTAEASGTAFATTLKGAVEAIEREMIVEAIKQTNGNMAKAAVQLDITERIMGLRVKKYDIDYRRFRTKM